MDEVIRHIEARHDEALGTLTEFISIPSVSTDPEHADDVRRCGEYCAESLQAIGFQKVEIIETERHPIVYAEWMGDPEKPTVLFYGHYDVQPVDPIELWNSPPFEATVRNGRIYGRGSVDDKGQIFAHWKAWEAHFATHGKLPCNVKVLLEGEEEVGSEGLEAFIPLNHDLLRADMVMISDSSMFAEDVPSLGYGLRGMAYMEIHVSGPKGDLHSGSFGGAVANPAQALTRIVASLKDHEDHIAIEGFYDRVRPLTEEERAEFRRLPFNEAEFRQQTGVPEVAGEAGFTTLERVWARPALDVNGIISGFTGKGAKTVLPAKASAKVSMRLVADQEPNEIADLFARHVEAVAPPGVRVEVEYLHGGPPYLADRDHPGNLAAKRALAKAFEAEPVFTREGGSIPVTTTFQRELGLTSVMMGLGLPDQNAHAPDENLSVRNFQRGIVAAAHFYNEYEESSLAD